MKERKQRELEREKEEVIELNKRVKTGNKNKVKTKVERLSNLDIENYFTIRSEFRLLNLSCIREIKTTCDRKRFYGV